MEGQAADISLSSSAASTKHRDLPSMAKPAYAGPLKPHDSSQRLATEVAKANMDWSLAQVRLLRGSCHAVGFKSHGTGVHQPSVKCN